MNGMFTLFRYLAVHIDSGSDHPYKTPYIKSMIPLV